MMKSRALLVLLSCGAAAACALSEPPSKYPRREPGCDVRVFPERPSYNVENIGPVNATCDEGTADAECLRTLMDQVCKLGGDTVWGVSDKPELKNEKKFFAGRAAHQK